MPSEVGFQGWLPGRQLLRSLPGQIAEMVDLFNWVLSQPFGLLGLIRGAGKPDGFTDISESSLGLAQVKMRKPVARQTQPCLRDPTEQGRRQHILDSRI